METSMKSFYTTLFAKEKTPYYTSLHNLAKIRVAQIRQQLKTKPKPTRGWVMWVEAFAEGDNEA